MTMALKTTEDFMGIALCGMATAAQAQRNEDFYRGLVDACAKALGQAAYTDDEGAVHSSPIRLKVPELVKAAVEGQCDYTVAMSPTRALTTHCSCEGMMDEKAALMSRIETFQVGAGLLTEGQGMNTSDKLRLLGGVNQLVDTCHAASKASGWWHDIETGEPLPVTQERVGDKLMLIVTEIAEAKEGHRKGLADTHLPRRSALEVELADAMIRIADLAGKLGLDLGGAVVDKLIYNASRADHKLENRRGKHGKKT